MLSSTRNFIKNAYKRRIFTTASIPKTPCPRIHTHKLAKRSQMHYSNMYKLLVYHKILIIK